MKSKNTNKAELVPAQSGQHTPIAEKQEELQRLAKVINHLASERDELLKALRLQMKAKNNIEVSAVNTVEARAAIARAEGRKE